jgi:threonine dehydrogenase-like Zn-dependent dehydrogenase
VLAEKLWGYSPAGIFGYSHITGGYAGGQAEYVRVPFADVGAFKVPEGLTDDQVLFLTDIFPTGYQAAEYCNIQPGDTVAVWGCGPVGLFTVASARLLGAERIIAIDRFPERLRKAEQYGAETVNYEEIGNTLDIVDVLRDMTGGQGPDSCIDAVGLEAHGVGLEWWYDKAKRTVMAQTGRPIALRQAIMSCRKGGTVSIPGVYGGILDKIPMGAAMNKSLAFRMGQTHVHRYIPRLLEHIQNGDIDPTLIITHHMSLEDAPHGYDIFSHKEDECVKVVLRPNGVGGVH